MSRYSINFDKTINQLLPHFFGGRKLTLYLQALLKPLQTVNDIFVQYANETHIDTVMTSQKIKFEWYLNRRLSKYFLDSGNISVVSTVKHGFPIYFEDRNQKGSENIILHMAEENSKNLPLRYEDETIETEDVKFKTCSFVVYSPAINTQLISEEDYIKVLSNYIDKYRIANKTYVIKFNQ